MNQIPKDAYRIWGEWLAQSPTESTFRIITSMHDAIQVGGVEMARKLFDTPGSPADVKKAMLDMLDYIYNLEAIKS